MPYISHGDLCDLNCWFRTFDVFAGAYSKAHFFHSRCSALNILIRICWIWWMDRWMEPDKPGEKQDSNDAEKKGRRTRKNATLNAQIGQAKLVFITLRIVNETQMRNKLQCVCSIFSLAPFFALAYLLSLSFLSSAWTVRICVCVGVRTKMFNSEVVHLNTLPCIIVHLCSTFSLPKWHNLSCFIWLLVAVRQHCCCCWKLPEKYSVRWL